jgi:hypothetical protein
MLQTRFRYIAGLSILDFAVEIAAMVLLDFFCEQYAQSLLFVFLVFCHFLPIYFASQEPWTARRIRHYIKYILKIYLAATLLYVLVCIPFAALIFTNPTSMLNQTVAQKGECAYRFSENQCSLPTNSNYKRARVERECFALAMCLRQPVFIIKIHALLVELLAQVLSPKTCNAFVGMTGGYIGWGLSNGRWMNNSVGTLVAAAPQNQNNGVRGRAIRTPHSQPVPPPLTGNNARGGERVAELGGEAPRTPPAPTRRRHREANPRIPPLSPLFGPRFNATPRNTPGPRNLFGQARGGLFNDGLEPGEGYRNSPVVPEEDALPVPRPADADVPADHVVVPVDVSDNGNDEGWQGDEDDQSLDDD